MNGLYKDSPYDTYRYYVKAEGYVNNAGSFSLSAKQRGTGKEWRPDHYHCAEKDNGGRMGRYDRHRAEA